LRISSFVGTERGVAEKLDQIGAKSETSPRKSLAEIAQQTLSV
jgi:hypothetical protein